MASVIVAATAVVVWAPPAAATSITVNTAVDIAPHAATGRFPTDGRCSLRAAIRSAQSNSNADDVDCATGLGNRVLDTIHIDPSLAGRTLTLSYATTSGVQPFDDITGTDNPLEIIGPTMDAADFVIDANDSVRPFDVGVSDFDAGELTLANLTVRGGNGHANGGFSFAPDRQGGAFFLGMHSHLTLDNVVVRNNSVECVSGKGGAIYGVAPTITNKGGAYVDNRVDCPPVDTLFGQGGAIFVEQGPWTLDGYAVLFQGNSAPFGGAIATNPGSDSALVHLERSLLRNNVAAQGGVLHIDSAQRGTVFELSDSTAYANSSVFFSVANTQRFSYLRDTFVDTGEVFRTGGGVMANTIVTGTSTCTSTGINAFTGSHNLLDAGPGKCGNLALLGSIGTVTKLAPALAQNGGPQVQQTFALQPGSNAIDTGDPAYCGEVDARSVARGIDGDGTVDSPQARDCDIGAYEYAKSVVNFTTGTSSVREGAGTVTIPVRLRLLDPDLQTLTSPLVVDVAEGAGSTATVGPDLQLDDLDVAGNAVTFPAGSHDGAVANVVVPVHQDDVAEAQGEFALLDLVAGGTPGVVIAEPRQHRLSIQDDDQAGVVVDDGGDGTTVSESAPDVGDTLSVGLQSQPDRVRPGDPTSPGADVAVRVEPDRDCTVDVDGQPGSVGHPAVITIRNADWELLHVVTVKAVDDRYDEDLRDEGATHRCELRFSFSSPDPVYDATQDAYDVSVRDNDVAGVSLTQVDGPAVLAEGSATGQTYAVRLDTPPNPSKPPAPPRGPTTVVVTPTAGCDVGSGAGVARSFAFDDTTWDVPQPFRLTASDDLRVDLRRTCDVVTSVRSPDPVYANLDDAPVFAHTPPSVAVDVVDYGPPTVTDDPPFVVVDTGDGVGVDEHAPGTRDSVSVRLLRAPVGGPVAVTLTSPLDPATGDRQVLLASGGTPAGSVTVSFDATTWDAPKQVDVYPVDDAFDEDDPHQAPIDVTMSSTARGFDDPTLRKVVVDGVATSSSGTVLATVADDDTSAVDLVESGGSTQVAEGGATDTVGVRLATHPYADVTVTVTAGPRCTVDGGSSTTVTVTAAAWDVAIGVTVAAVDDALLQGPTTCTITASAASPDGRYEGVASQVVASVADDELPEVLVATGDPAHVLHVAEAGATADALEVTLSARPTADVTVTATSLDGQTSGGSVTFTPTDWDQPHQLVVHAVDDQVDETDVHPGPVSIGVTSSAAGYSTAPQVLVDGVAATTVGVEVTDDDSAALVLSTPSLSLTEGGPDAVVGVALATQPTQRVDVGVTASGLCSVAPATLAFDDATWSVRQPLRVTPGDDDVVHAQQCVVHLAAVSADPTYDGRGADAVGPVADDDVPSVSVSPTTLTLSEAAPATTATYSVVLTSRPTSDVTVTARPDGQVTSSGGPLVFTPATWDVPQTVTAGVVDDTLVEPTPHTGLVTHSVTSTDPEYDGIAVDSVTVDITDDETTTTLTSAPNPSNDGVHTIADVLVAGAGTPTGTVRVSVDGAAGASGVLVGGKASVDLGVLAHGTHSVSAAYGGDSAHAPSGDAISLVVTAVPQARDDAVTVAEDSGVTPIDVLANDTDADGDVLSIASVQQAAHGTVTCGTTSCSYQPAPDFNGADSFRYVVSDGALTTAATVTVTVTAVDDPPTVRTIDVRAVSGTPTRFDLLTGATDVDGDVLSLLGHTNPRHGTLSCGPDGRCSYTSAAGYAGADGFAYTVGEPPPTTAATPSGTRSALARPLGSPATATGTVRIEVVAPAAGRSSGGGGSLARTGTPVDRPWAPGIALLGLGLLLVAAVATDRGRSGPARRRGGGCGI